MQYTRIIEIDVVPPLRSGQYLQMPIKLIPRTYAPVGRDWWVANRASACHKQRTIWLLQ